MLSYPCVKTSRQGRATQRWITDPDSHETIRLTTGCVPILRGGKILFVSASRKPEWILPKGGWELDETMEESAVRECFEEAGVLGVLGPKLSDIQYETRQSQKTPTPVGNGREGQTNQARCGRRIERSFQLQQHCCAFVHVQSSGAIRGRFLERVGRDLFLGVCGFCYLQSGPNDALSTVHI